MGNLTLLIGIGICAIIFIYMFFKLGETKTTDGKSHFLLQILMLFFVIMSIFLIGKTTLDDNNNCSWNVINQTVSGDTTTYTNSYECSAITNNTANVFYKMATWFASIVAGYVFIYFTYQISHR